MSGFVWFIYFSAGAALALVVGMIFFVAGLFVDIGSTYTFGAMVIAWILGVAASAAIIR
ncbi:hypothetical protein ACLB6G_20270 [Zhengella sp. ZM62]|uniref:hypothetical protein n=1 Tax=Zhengella sedimenti TaxID=3390035 RepID=UPI0039768358